MKASPSSWRGFSLTINTSGLFSHRSMPSSKLTMSPVSLFFLEVVVASVVVRGAITPKSATVLNSTSVFDETSPTVTPTIPDTTGIMITADPNSNITSTPKSHTEKNFSLDSTTVPSRSGPNGTSFTKAGVETIPPKSRTPPPFKTTQSTTTKIPPKNATPKPSTPKPSTPKPLQTSEDTTGIVILIVIIIVVLAFGITFCVVRKRGRRYSVDVTSRMDEADVPLSTVEPQFPAEAVPQNGLQTFESIETPEKDPETTAKDPETTEKKLEEPEVKPETQEEQKAEADKPPDPSPQSEAPAPSPAPESSETKPNEDSAGQSSPAEMISDTPMSSELCDVSID